MAKKIVTGDQYFEIDGQLTEIKRQLRQKSGYPYNLHLLMRALQRVIEGEFDLLPTTITVGGRIYGALCFHDPGERFVESGIMVERAKDMRANLGGEEREHFLKHQADIPVALRGEITFVFTDDRDPGDPDDPECPPRVCCVEWHGDCWVKCWRSIGHRWDEDNRVLRRIA